MVILNDRPSSVNCQSGGQKKIKIGLHLKGLFLSNHCFVLQVGDR